MRSNRSKGLAYLRRILIKFWSTPELFLVFVGALFGSAFILITPPLQGPDEPQHFLRAYQVSEGGLLPGGAADNMPSSLYETYKRILYSDDIRFKANEKYELHNTKAALAIPLEPTKEENYANTTIYAPVAYLPHAIMIALGRVVEAPPVVLIYLARFGGLLAWLGLLYLSIRISPIGKWPITVFGLIPMTIFQAAIINTDVASGGLLFLYIAVILSLLKRKTPLDYRAYAAVGLIGSLMALSKQSMILMLPMAFLLMFRRWPNTKTRKFELYKTLGKLLLAIIVPVVLVGLWMYITKDTESIDVAANGSIPGEQIRQIISDPGRFGFALWNMNFHTWGDEITRSFIGTFGWVDVPMALSFTIIGYVALFVALVTNRAKDNETLSELSGKLPRFLLALLAVGYFVGVSAMLYVFNSPVRFSVIVGLQGRYFLPLLPLLLILVANNDQLKMKPKLYNFFVKVVPISLLIVSGIYLTIRYYFQTII